MLRSAVKHAAVVGRGELNARACGTSRSIGQISTGWNAAAQGRAITSSAVQRRDDIKDDGHSDDTTRSFSDAHFGQERDREMRKAAKRREQDPDIIAKDVKPSSASIDELADTAEADHEHAVISTFDLFSIGIGPSSSHTVGPMRAGRIFVNDLVEAGLLEDVARIRISIYGSLAATGEGHMTPSALLLGLEGTNVETVDTAYVPLRFDEIRGSKKLHLGREDADAGGGKIVQFDYDRDFVFEWGKTLPTHSNGMRLTVFDHEGTMLATNDLFSVGGGFVVNSGLSTAGSSKGDSGNDKTKWTEKDTSTAGHPGDLAENLYYKSIRRSDATGDRRAGADLREHPDVERHVIEESLGGSLPSIASSALATEEETTSGHPKYPFRNAASLLALCKRHNLTIAQLVYENERSLGYSDVEIRTKLLDLWSVMDNCIKEGVQAEDGLLPGSLGLQRRAPALYKRLTRGLYASANGLIDTRDARKSLTEAPPGTESKSTARKDLTATTASKPGGLPSLRRGPPRVVGSLQHPILPTPPRRTNFAAIDWLSVYAIATNEVNAMGGRVVTAPTNGAAGIIPAVLKYFLEFMSEDEERDVLTFLLTASAIGMLYKRGATISAAEGGCQAEVGTSCSMAAGALAACLGASPEVIEQAAEIGIEHNLGLTCDPIGGLVQAPCIERNALGAIKALGAANLALSSSGTQRISLDEAIRAMRVTGEKMSADLKESSLSGLATSVSMRIPVSVPDC